MYGIANYIKTEFDKNYNDDKTMSWNCVVVPKEIAQGIAGPTINGGPTARNWRQMMIDDDYKHNHNTRFQFVIGELRIDMWRNSA